MYLSMWTALPALTAHTGDSKRNTLEQYILTQYSDSRNTGIWPNVIQIPILELTVCPNNFTVFVYIFKNGIHWM